ncbi:hypothetical protein HG535_0A06270 [Zygotorulaspora mrakii]|uniref:Autophagy-related protein 29 n=1 Tax=Zygotorulaspora mrakii TaxID=42260 RepID=A0A7H9AWG4_ZYGMR|nr:uncharacterized protein HG535_0A06270 [Zygotorulaspora mrakii]QLG70685.1 hypothetical protein HG535_0A06270 [Zygotorulaspora mrakii]
MNNKNTLVYVKVHGKRPDQFKDPIPFVWTRDKEKQLWQTISKLDNYQDQIDWDELSRNLEAPQYFLKKRSYKLSANHLKLLEQHIEARMKKNYHEEQEANKQQPDLTIKHSLSGNKESFRRQAYTEVDTEETTLRAFQKMQASKLLNRRKIYGGADKNGKNVGSNNDSDSDASSSLSISDSALEEALMDRLHL